MNRNKDNKDEGNDSKNGIAETVPVIGGQDDKGAMQDEKHHKHAKDKTKELKDIEDKLLRLQADFDNFRKRMIREKTEMYLRANEDLMSELLPVLDHMDLAIQAAKDHGAHNGIIDGFKLVSEQFLTAFNKFGLTAFDSTGKRFDPAEQEAISHIPSDSVPSEMVINQTRRGYKLGGRLLRPSQVVVSCGKPEGTDIRQENKELSSGK